MCHKQSSLVTVDYRSSATPYFPESISVGVQNKNGVDYPHFPVTVPVTTGPIFSTGIQYHSSSQYHHFEIVIPTVPIHCPLLIQMYWSRGKRAFCMRITEPPPPPAVPAWTRRGNNTISTQSLLLVVFSWIQNWTNIEMHRMDGSQYNRKNIFVSSCCQHFTLQHKLSESHDFYYSLETILQYYNNIEC